jgi:hypothetical protein
MNRRVVIAAGAGLVAAVGGGLAFNAPSLRLSRLVHAAARRCSFKGKRELRDLPTLSTTLEAELAQVLSPVVLCRFEGPTPTELLGTASLAAELAGLHTAVDALELDLQSVGLDASAVTRLPVRPELDVDTLIVGSVVGHAHVTAGGSTTRRRFTAVVAMADERIGFVSVSLAAA